MAEEQKRWRAEKGGKYWIVHDDFTVCYHTDNRHYMDDVNYTNTNYFHTKAAAQAATDDIHKVLLRHAGELHDFTWAVAEMKKDNKVIQESDRGRNTDFWCNVENCIYLKDGHFVNDIDLDSPVFNLAQIEATDWEIYEDNPSQ